MKTYFILRLFPPIGILRKFRFDDVESLMETLSKLYDSLIIDKLDITDQQKNEWKKDPLSHFAECILVTKIDPSICLTHEKLFLGIEKKTKIKIQHIIPLHEATA